MSSLGFTIKRLCHNQSFENNVDFEEKKIITKQIHNNITRRYFQELVLSDVIKIAFVHGNRRGSTTQG